MSTETYIEVSKANKPGKVDAKDNKPRPRLYDKQALREHPLVGQKPPTFYFWFLKKH